MKFFIMIFCIQILFSRNSFFHSYQRRLDICKQFFTDVNVDVHHENNGCDMKIVNENRTNATVKEDVFSYLRKATILAYLQRIPLEQFSNADFERMMNVIIHL